MIRWINIQQHTNGAPQDITTATTDNKMVYMVVLKRDFISI